MEYEGGQKKKKAKGSLSSPLLCIYTVMLDYASTSKAPISFDVFVLGMQRRLLSS